MVASERDASGSLVLASGLPWKWIATGEGFSVRDLPTQYGTLSLQLCVSENQEIEVAVSGSLVIPAGGLRLLPPTPAGTSISSIEVAEGACKITQHDSNTVEILQLPLRARLRLQGLAGTLL